MGMWGTIRCGILLLTDFHRQLEDEKDHRNTTIQTTYDKLYPLWTMLGVSEAETEQFVNTWMGSTSDVVNAVSPSASSSLTMPLADSRLTLQYQSELSRMLTLKRSNLSAFIEREREALSSLWDVLYLSPPQRLASFPPFAISVAPSHVWNAVKGAEEEVVNDNVSEELLVAHERERERVELEVERTKPVLERLSKYFSVVEEMRELEASAADPSRLLGKATRGDPGRLLREEKARKRVVKEKPKVSRKRPEVHERTLLMPVFCSSRPSSVSSFRLGSRRTTDRSSSMAFASLMISNTRWKPRRWRRRTRRYAGWVDNFYVSQRLTRNFSFAARQAWFVDFIKLKSHRTSSTSSHRNNYCTSEASDDWQGRTCTKTTNADDNGWLTSTFSARQPQRRLFVQHGSTISTQQTSCPVNRS